MSKARVKAEPPEFVPCSVKTFEAEPDILAAAEHAVDINPVNAPNRGGVVALAGVMAAPLPPLMIALLTTKYWDARPRTLSVGFLESTGKPLKDRILSHMNAWNCGISFKWTAQATRADVRISRGGAGYWSYLGTDVLLIPKGQPTMNLQGFVMNTPESEYRRVVRHETGHTLGFVHEHMRRELVARLDPSRTIAYFEATQGWDAAMVEQQVLTPLEDAAIRNATPTDQTSLMCYQLPASITRDGRPITGGSDINRNDRAFCRAIYPPAAARNIA